MSVRSVLKYARISSQKARQVTRAITGMPVSQALSVLDFTPKKAAFLVGKTLRSAIANAENNHEQDASEFIVQSAIATPGPVLSRIMPRARGSAAPIKKRMTGWAKNPYHFWPATVPSISPFAVSSMLALVCNV